MDSLTLPGEVILPNEIKLVVFQSCDLNSLKVLRLVSKSWAEVGLDFLLLPTFVVSPQRCNIQRLLNISQHPALSIIAARTIRKVEFLSSDWDMSWFRSHFSSIIGATAPLTLNYFVPTQDERLALDELEAYDAHIGDIRTDCKIDRLVMAFKAVPNCHTITFSPRCIFQHQLLKKTWDEYIPGPCEYGDRKPQVEDVLKAAALAGLLPRHLIIGELSSRFPLTGPASEELLVAIRPVTTDLETFHLVIDDDVDVVQKFPDNAHDVLQKILSSMTKVKSISLLVASRTESWRISILPEPKIWSSLESLQLRGAQFDGQAFLSYLGAFRPTLKRLQILGMEITSGEMRWREFLEKLRDVVDLERFQLAGSIWYEDADGVQEVWRLESHVDENWRLYPKGEESISWQLEKFMLGDGPWPKIPEIDD